MKVDDRQQHLAGIGAGDTATLDIEVTKDWPEPSVPQDLATALADAPQNIRDLWNDITRWRVGSGCVGSTPRRTLTRADDGSR